MRPKKADIYIILYTMIFLLVFMLCRNIGLTYTLDVNLTKQRYSKWCWVSAAEATANYLSDNEGNYNKYEILRRIKGDQSDVFPNYAGDLEEECQCVELMSNKVTYYKYDWYSDPFSLSRINKFISKNIPIQASIGYYDGNRRLGGHIVLICGVDYKNNFIKYIDPWDGKSYWVNFDIFKNNLFGSSKYDGTIYAYEKASLSSSNYMQNTYEKINVVKNYSDDCDKLVDITLTDKFCKKPLKLRDLGNKYSIDEMNSVKKECEKKKQLIHKFTNNQNINIDLDKCYKVYNLKSMDLSYRFKMGVKFSSLIDSFYKWRCPVYDENNNLKYELCFENANNDKQNWKLTKVSDITEGMSAMYSIDILDTLRKRGYGNPDNITIVNADWFHIRIIYFLNNNEEYGYVLNSRNDLLKLQTGRIYKIQEIMDVLNKEFH